MQTNATTLYKLEGYIRHGTKPERKRNKQSFTVNYEKTFATHEAEMGLI